MARGEAGPHVDDYPPRTGYHPHNYWAGLGSHIRIPRGLWVRRATNGCDVDDPPVIVTSRVPRDSLWECGCVPDEVT